MPVRIVGALGSLIRVLFLQYRSIPVVLQHYVHCIEKKKEFCHLETMQNMQLTFIIFFKLLVLLPLSSELAQAQL